MTLIFQAKTRRAGNAAGLGKLSFPDGIDNRDLKPNRAALQAQFERLRRQRLVSHLHDLGKAPLYYFLREVEGGASIADHLEAYARIDPEFVRAMGGDQYPPALIAIDGGRR